MLAGCGGGGGGGAPPAPLASVLIASSTPALDGFVSSTGLVSSSSQLVVGDREASFPSHGGYRSFLSFDISTLPAGATIQSAVLRVYLVGAVGSPIAELGPLVVSHINYGTSLEASDFSPTVYAFNIATLATTTTAGWREVDVSSAVTADLGANARSQFRIEFLTRDQNADGQDQFLTCVSGDDVFVTGNVPELVITYLEP